LFYTTEPAQLKKGQESVRKLFGLFLIHQNLPERHEPFHSHKEHQFFVPLETPIEILLKSGQNLKIQPGQVAFLYSGLEHSFRSLGKSNAEQIIGFVECDIWEKNSPQRISITSLPALEIFDGNRFLKELLFYALITPHLAILNSLSSLICLSLWDGIENSRLSMLSKLSAKNRTTLDLRVLQSIKFMEERYFEEIELTEICLYISVNPRTLQRLFLKEFGFSPKKYLSFIRVKESLNLLKNSEMPISKIALEVGFGNFARYVEAFLGFIGKTPSEYRLEEKKMKLKV
jgi:AraC-like DNA-binding protein